MIRKVAIQELEKGMYISGFEKEGSDKALFFMNNILVKNKKDLDDFERYGYHSAYIVVDEPMARPPVESSNLPTREEPDSTVFDAGAAAADNSEQPASPSMPTKLGLVPKRVPAPETETPEPEVDPEVEELLAEENSSVDVVELSSPETLETNEIIETETPETTPEITEELEAEPPLETETEAPVEHARVVEPEKESDYEAYDSKDDVEIEDLIRFDEEIEAATVIRSEAEDLVRDFMTNAAMGKAIEPKKIHKTVEAVIESAFRNQDAITSLTRLKNADEYTYGHCINVCILSIAIARRMGFDKEALQKLGVGAMLHDVGKALVPEDILKKAGPLSDTEFENMKTHTTLGIEYLKEMPEIPEASLHVVAQHHEKFNGTGYPSNREGERIHIFARIAAVADVYDAMTSTRCYQQGMLPDIALQKIYMLREKQFEPTLVERLIKCLGIYPIGTVVELNTGEVAVVKGANHANPLQPKISMLFNAQGDKFKKAFQIDLKNASSKWVVSSRKPESMGLDIDDIIA